MLLLLSSGCFLLTPEDLAARLALGDSAGSDTPGDDTGAIDSGSRDCDADADGASAEACGGPDCDDADAGRAPDVAEVCDGVDQDCDGAVDEDATDALTWYTDADGDGQGDPTAPVVACDLPDGAVATSRDCDDTDPTVYTGAPEVCNGVDDDCTDGADGRFAVPGRYATIQAAIDDASTGGEVCVAAGTYLETLVLADKAIVLEGTGAGLTIVDGGGDGSVVTVSGAAPTLRGLTLTGGSAAAGAGIFVGGDGVTLEDVEITGNACAGASCVGVGAWLTGELFLSGVSIHDDTVDLAGSGTPEARGVGAHVEDASGTWSDVSVADNAVTSDGAPDMSVVFGVGLDLQDTRLSVTGLALTGNTASGATLAPVAAEGGGLALDGDGSDFDDVRIADNRLAFGGASAWVVGAGVFAADSSSRFTHLRVSENTVDGANALGAAVYLLSGTPTFTNALVYANASEDADGTSLGTIHLEHASATFTNADVVGNTLAGGYASGGGFSLGSDAALTLRNVSVAQNTLSSTLAYGGAVYAATGGSVGVTYSNFHDNGADAFEGLTEPSAGDGNVAIDPGYTNVSGDPGSWDLTLAAGSGLIDAGDPGMVDGDGSRCDVGGYGGEGGAWP